MPQILSSYLNNNGGDEKEKKNSLYYILQSFCAQKVQQAQQAIVN